MVTTDAIEGIIDGMLRFHYDLQGDVLYIRFAGDESSSTIGELTDEGDILLREEKSDRPVGLTVVSSWKRFGKGAVPDSIREIAHHIEPFAQKFAA